MNSTFSVGPMSFEYEMIQSIDVSDVWDGRTLGIHRFRLDYVLLVCYHFFFGVRRSDIATRTQEKYNAFAIGQISAEHLSIETDSLFSLGHRALR